MPIKLEDIKLMASQRLTDNDDGGGRMSGTEIVDGNINNMFTDISRLDRVYGRVSLREGFIHVDTPTTDTYSGAHAIISVPAQDPKVSVCMFKTSKLADQRDAARDRIESYVTLGPRMQAWLWGDQPGGSRTLLLYAPVKSELPDIGSVLCLFNHRGEPAEQKQYVRITGVKSEIKSFTVVVDGTTKTFERRVLHLDIGDPLQQTFLGEEVSENDAKDTAVYTTVVSDASKYFGVMIPKEGFSSGDISLPVESIYTHLVPSAQGESPMVDLSPGEAGPVFESGELFTFSLSQFQFKSGAQITVGRAVKPGSLVITRTSATPAVLKDNGAGVVMNGSTQYATIDYGTGTVTFAGAINDTSNCTVECIIGVAVPVLPNSYYVPVELASRGYNWTHILDPPPLPGSLKVDYMAQGKWFRLTDLGKGELSPETAGAGTGTINYTTGSVALTCGALPDIGSAIMYQWGNPIECVDLSGDVEVDAPEMKAQLPKFPVDPSSVVIDWQTGTDPESGDPFMARLTDNGSGVLTGDGAGVVSYATGEVRWTPSLLSIPSKDYEINYQSYPLKEGPIETSGNGLITFTLADSGIKKGSVVLRVNVPLSGISHTFVMKDDSNGNLSAPGASFNVSFSKPQWPGSAQVSGITGTINYITGLVTIDLSTVSGTERYSEPTMKWKTPTGSYRDLQWMVLYKPYPSKNVIFPTLSPSTVLYSYSITSAAAGASIERVAAPDYVIDIFPGAGYSVQPGSVTFEWQGATYIDKNGKLYKDINHATGNGVEAGSIDYTTGECRCSLYGNGSPTVKVISLVGRIGKQLSASLSFRCPGAPLRPGSINLVGTLSNGSKIALSSNFDGKIEGTGGRGEVDYEKGIVTLSFGEMVVDDPAFATEPWYDPSHVEGGKVFKPQGAFAETITYGCVVYSYIPLDAGLIGLNPVRLPTDGRVPIVRRGDVVVVHNTLTEQLSSSVTAGTTITLNRAPDNLEIYDSAVPATRVSNADFEVAEDDVTFTESFDPTKYILPLVAMNKIEDMSLVSDVDITGRVTIANGLTKDFPKEKTFVSSALLFGDLQARLHSMFDQKTWSNEWSDSLIGDATIANFNEVSFPPRVTNAGAVTERWALIFTATDTFNIVGEVYGVVAEGRITQDCAPLNPATGTPFFFLDYRGFGSGWSAGNVIRFNTAGASPPFWVARTTLQGPASNPEDQFTIQIRGDAE